MSIPAGEPVAPTDAQRLALRERPAARAVGRQRWNHLLFAHWTVDPAAVQATLPRGLFVDTFGGAAYVGIVPFFMERVRPTGLPPVPGLSWFLELNVRTYVHDAVGCPGVWFYSLDCNQRLAVAIARRFFHLPYFFAEMTARGDRDGLVYTSRRGGSEAGPARYEWREGAASAPAAPGTLDFFLVERYQLFAADGRGQLYGGRVHHAPYQVNRPMVEEWSVEPARLAGFDLQGPPASLLAARPVDVEIFALTKGNVG